MWIRVSPSAITVKAKNQGNAAITAGGHQDPDDPDTQAIVEKWESTMALAVSEQKILTQTWSTTNVPARSYIVMASITHPAGSRDPAGAGPVTVVNTSDTSPDAFTLAPTTNVALNTLVESDTEIRGTS